MEVARGEPGSDDSVQSRLAPDGASAGSGEDLGAPWGRTCLRGGREGVGGGQAARGGRSHGEGDRLLPSPARLQGRAHGCGYRGCEGYACSREGPG